MSVRIKPDQLSKVVSETLDDYKESLSEKVKKSVKDAAIEAVKDLKATSPKLTGRYAKSWKQKKLKEISSEMDIVVHAGRYQLTHLLENGHAKRGGGRVRAIPHIRPVEQKVSEKLERDIKKEAQDG
jgi:hypothetical protein